MSNNCDYLLDCASLEDIHRYNLRDNHERGNAGEIDLNDELQIMQDITCFKIYKRRLKKNRRYKEWKKDEILEGDMD